MFLKRNALYNSQSIAAPISEVSSFETDVLHTKTYIVIVGPNRPLNQALGFCLGSAIGAECTCERCFPHGAIADSTSDRINAYLLDCLTLDRDAIENQLHSCGNTLTENIKIVLFNVGTGCNLGQMASRKEMWGIFHKDDLKSIFLKGMRAILNGRKWIPRCYMPTSVLKSPVENEPPEQLLKSISFREKEILQLVAVGMSNTEIATEMAISLHTVKTHIYNIYKKIDVSNRLQAALWVTAHYPKENRPQQSE